MNDLCKEGSCRWLGGKLTTTMREEWLYLRPDTQEILGKVRSGDIYHFTDTWVAEVGREVIAEFISCEAAKRAVELEFKEGKKECR